MSTFELPKLSLGEVFISRKVSITPLFFDHGKQPDWIEFTDAFDQGLVSVNEVSESGSVQSVIVSNRSKHPLVILEGQGLQGAKQNRALQKTVVVAPQSEQMVPVNCVEQGRWQYRTRDFSPGDFASTPSMKVRKSDAFVMDCSVDQGMVWDEVSQLSEKAGVYSASSDLGEVLSVHKKSAPKEATKTTEFKQNFDAPGFLVNAGNVSFIELFGDPVWAKRALVKGWDTWVVQADNKKAKIPTLPTHGLEWTAGKSVALESQWVTENLVKGYSATFEGSLVHLFLGKEKRVKKAALHDDEMYTLTSPALTRDELSPRSRRFDSINIPSLLSQRSRDE